MSKVVAIMSMSLDGYVADLDDGVAEVFNWYFTSGDVEIQTGGSDPMTFKVSEPSAKHLRNLTSGLGAVLTGRCCFLNELACNDLVKASIVGDRERCVRRGEGSQTRRR